MWMLAGTCYWNGMCFNSFIQFRSIGVIYESLRDHNERPAIFGAPNEGEIIEQVNPMGGWNPVQFIYDIYDYKKYSTW